MKKIIISIFIMAVLSCNNNSSQGILNDHNTDTSNSVGDTSNKSALHPGPNGYAPPNAQGGDSLKKKDSLNQK
jgi:hypothetical protein